MLALTDRQEKMLLARLEGTRYKELSYKYGLSINWVEQIFNEIYKLLGLRLKPSDNREDREKAIQKAANEYFELKRRGKLLT